MELTTIDLFAGCGGLSAGFNNAGIENIAGYDNWNAAVDVYNANNKDHAEVLDLSDVENTLARLEQYKGNIDGIIGGPPCQDFSLAGKRVEGDRAALTIKYANIIKDMKPTFFVMENVARAEKAEAYKKALDILTAAGYGISKRVIDASRVGVPQSRKRLITIGWLNANKNDEIGQLLDAGLSEHRTTMRDYFGDSLNTEHVYRHPRSYQRRAIFSIDEPHPTIRGTNRAVAPGYPGHPADSAPKEQARSLTTEERARVQTFEGWRWEGSRTSIEQMIGNAVPVKLAEYIARAIIAYADSIAYER